MMSKDANSFDHVYFSNILESMPDPASFIPPSSESRFLAPPNWRWHHFKNRRGMRIRYGSVFPKDKIPDAVVIALPGLSEYGEKYFELAHDMLARNLAFWVIDWAGQGSSDRYFKDSAKGRQRRHSDDFSEDVADLRQLIMEYIKPASVHPDVGRIGHVMIGHSMGAHIGLRYLLEYPDTILAAAFAAPMMGIKATGNAPGFVTSFLTNALTPLHKSYVAGNGDWQTSRLNRMNPGKTIFSSDPVRDALHDGWMDKNPDLRVGHVTYGWVHQALKSCATLEQALARSELTTPTLVAIAGRDELVNNNKITRILGRQKNVTLLDLPEARHEILMENDSIRGLFMQKFDDLLTNHVLSCDKRVKPF